MIYYIFYQQELKIYTDKVIQNQQAVLNASHLQIAEKLNRAHHDILFMAKNPVVENYIDNKTVANRHQMEQFFYDFMVTRRNLFDQMRYLDKSGMEIARVNNYVHKAEIIKQKDLQNKASRYYFQEGLALQANQIYLSPLDLNVEHGQIEQPIKPTIRFVIRALDHQGKPDGVLVINFLAGSLLQQLASYAQTRDLYLLIANHHGDWFIGPNKQSEWGFMYPQQSRSNFQRYNSAIWEKSRQLKSQSVHLFNQESNPASVTMFRPQDDIAPNNKSRFLTNPDTIWTLLAEVNKENFKQFKQSILYSLIPSFVLLSILFAVLVILIMYYAFKEKQAALAAFQRGQQLNDLIESIPDALIVVNEQGKIQLINEQTEVSFQYSRDQLIGQPIELLVPTRYHHLHEKNRQEYINNPINRAMGENKSLYACRQDGSEFPVAIALNHMKTKQHNWFISVIRDMTEVYKANEKSNLANERLKIATQSGKIGVWEYDNINNELIWDEQMYQLYNVQPEQFNGAYDSWKGRVHPEDIDKAESALSKTLEGVQDFNSQFRIIISEPAASKEKDQQQIRWIQANAKAVYNHQQQVIRIIGTNIDITEEMSFQQQISEALVATQKSVHALSQANKELDSFSYSVSHDLRAPLRSIDGFSRIILKKYQDKLDQQGVHILERMRIGAQKMGQMIDDILVLSRISRMEINKETLDFSLLAQDSVDILREGEPQRQVDISIEQDLTVLADKRLLPVVLNNLIGNAWKFTSKKDNASIEIGSRVNEQSNQLEYFVKDNGAGFDMDYMEKIFAPFQRLHTSEEFQGTGIGLASVQRVIQNHGGKIYAESKENEGASFYFTLS